MFSISCKLMNKIEVSKPMLGTSGEYIVTIVTSKFRDKNSLQIS